MMRGEEFARIGRFGLVCRDGEVYIVAASPAEPVSRADLQALLDAYPDGAE